MRLDTRSIVAFGVLVMFGVLSAAEGPEPKTMSEWDVLSLRQVGDARISPDGGWAAYTVIVPRRADEEAGSSFTELHVVSIRTGQSRGYVTGGVNVRSPRWSPDGNF